MKFLLLNQSFIKFTTKVKFISFSCSMVNLETLLLFPITPKCASSEEIDTNLQPPLQLGMKLTRFELHNKRHTMHRLMPRNIKSIRHHTQSCCFLYQIQIAANIIGMIHRPATCTSPGN